MRFHEIVPIFNLLVGRRLDVAVFGHRRSVPEQVSVPRTFLLHGEELAEIRGRWKARDEPIASVVDGFLRHADQILPLPARSVREKKDAVWGESTGDYVSLARYWWPNSSTEDGLPFVLRDGEINPDVYSDTFDLARLEEFSYHSFVLAFAYAISGDELYAQRCAELIEHWCLAPESCQSPNFEYAQIRPGQKRGGGVGTIEAHRLIYVVEAAQLIAESPHWPETQAVALKGWFSALLTWLRTSRTGLNAGERTNNIGVWYDVQCATYALYTGDLQLAANIVQDSGMRRLDAQLGSHGSFPAELLRTRPYDYFAFNLLAYMALARVGESVDVDLWARQLPDGRSLEAAVQWLRNIVQPEAFSFEVGQRAARSTVNLGARDEAAPKELLLRALSDEVESLRWKVRAAAADRGELVTLLRGQERRAERLLGLVAAMATQGRREETQVAGQVAVNAADPVRRESMKQDKMSQGYVGAEVTALCVEVERLHQEKDHEQRERKSATAAVAHLERRLREEEAVARVAERQRDEALAERAEASLAEEYLRQELHKASRKIAGLEDAVARMLRARAENEGRLRDRYEYLLQEQGAKAEKKLSAQKAKSRADAAALEQALTKLASVEKAQARERKRAKRLLEKAQAKEKRKCRALELREQQALVEFADAAAIQEQLAVQSARLRAELARLRRPVLARVKGRLIGNAWKDQKRIEEDFIEASGIVSQVKRLQNTDVTAEALRQSSSGQLNAVLPLFAADWYVARYPDVLLSWDSPLAEHLAEGGRSGRRPHPLFWSAWYAKRYLADEADVCPLVHFLANAAERDLDPNPYFDSNWYRRTHLSSPDVKAVPLLHYIDQGRKAGLQTSPRADLDLVRQHHAKARALGGDALAVLLELPLEERARFRRSARAGGRKI